MIRRMGADTGKWLLGLAAVEQAVRRTILVPRGSQILNREFGSDLHRYLDMPQAEVKIYLANEISKALGALECFALEELSFNEEAASTGVTLTLVGRVERERVTINVDTVRAESRGEYAEVSSY